MKYGMVMLVLMMALAGCGTKADEESHASHRHVNGDIQESTASIEELPTFLDGLHENIGEVYRLAGLNAELLDVIPCFCGCGGSAGHRSNKNCFIKEIQADGTVIWDDHGTRCAVCMEIVVLSAKMKAEGKSDLEIRQFIDETYKEGYAPPTPTPMPA
jgi:hypothetical protein